MSTSSEATLIPTHDMQFSKLPRHLWRLLMWHFSKDRQNDAYSALNDDEKTSWKLVMTTGNLDDCKHFLETCSWAQFWNISAGTDWDEKTPSREECREYLMGIQTAHLPNEEQIKFHEFNPAHVEELLSIFYSYACSLSSIAAKEIEEVESKKSCVIVGKKHKTSQPEDSSSVKKAKILTCDTRGEASRSSLLDVAKKRALDYLKNGDPRNALMSLLSDFGKWNIYEKGSFSFTILLMMTNQLDQVTEKFIMDFN